jgi:hypothetical protein
MVSLPIIQTIGIRLTDDRHRSINLNGLHFQLSLKVSFIHKEILRPLPPRRIAPNTEVKIDERKKSKKK